MKDFDDLKPEGQRRRIRRARALLNFLAVARRPLSKAPKNEMPAAKRLRLIKDVLKRIALFEQAGLVPRNEQMRYHWLYKKIEYKRMLAYIDAKIESGDF